MNEKPLSEKINEYSAKDWFVTAAIWRTQTIQLQVTAVADGKTLAGELDLLIIPGDATQIALTPGTPVDA